MAANLLPISSDGGFTSGGNININNGAEIVTTINEDLNIVVQDEEDDGWSLYQTITDGFGTNLARTSLDRSSFTIDLEGGDQWQFDGKTLQTPTVGAKIKGYDSNLAVQVMQGILPTTASLQAVSNQNDPNIFSTFDATINAANIKVYNGGSNGGVEYAWQFDNQGNLTFPRDDANGDPILVIGGGADPSISSVAAGSAGPANLDIIAQNTIFSGFSGDEIRIYPDDGEIGSTGNLQLWANAGSNTQYSWTFGTDGMLTVPYEGVIRSNDDTIILESYDTSNLTTRSMRFGTNGALYLEEYGPIPINNRTWLTIDPNAGNTEITAASGILGSTAGGNLSIAGGDAFQSTYNTSPGGNVNITGGLGASDDGGGGGPGGSVNISAGLSADPAGVAGNVVITTGGTSYTFNELTLNVTTNPPASPAPILSGFGFISAPEFTNGTGNITVNANSKIWTFDSTGNLTLPGNSFNINYANGTQVSLGGGGSGGNSISDGTSNVSVTSTGGNVAINVDNNAASWTFATDGIIYNKSEADYKVLVTDPNEDGYGVKYYVNDGSQDLSSTSLTGDQFSIYTDLPAGGYEWRFSGNTLQVSTNSTIRAFDSNVIVESMSAGGTDVASLRSVSNQNDPNIFTTFDATPTGANIIVYNGGSNGGTGHTWQFDNNGNLTLPSNTFAINYANGDQVSIGGGGSSSSIANGNSNVDIATANSNVTISAVGNTTMTITGTGANITGTLNATGNITGANFVGTLANGNSNISITSNSNVVTNINNSPILTTYSGGIKIGGSGYIQSPGGAVAITVNNNGANISTANIGSWLNVTGSNGATITGASATGIGALNAGATTTQLPNTIASFTSNINYYTQVTLQNKSGGTDATTDYVLTADNGSDTVNYGDFGIINSGYDANTPTNSLGNIVYAADTYLYAQGNTGNSSQSGGNLAIGTTVPGKNVKIFAGGVNNSSIIANISNTGIAVNGNVTATNFSGNISITGNVTGTSANVTLVAGSYSYTFDNTGTLTLPAAGSGDEGGEIAFTQAANSTLAGNTVVMDNYVDRFRFFEAGGNARGAYIDLSIAADGVGTLLNNRASGIVNAGVDVTLGNLKARIPTSGNRSLQVSTVSGSYSVYGSAQYTAGGTIGGTNIVSGFAVSVTTTPAYLSSGNNFLTAGDAGQWIITDVSAGLAWRITFIIGASFNNNLITIERLV